MYCEKAVFYEKQNRIDFIGHVLISDTLRSIQAEKIEYFPDRKLAVCLGRVHIQSPDTNMRSRYFSYNFITGQAQAREDLFIDDRKDHVKIWGGEGFHNDEKKYSLVQQNAKLMRIDTSAADTLLITGGKIEYFGGDSAKAVASDSVTITKGDLTAHCDTAIYLPEAQTAWLNFKPRAYYKENRLTGQRMKVRFDSLKIKEILVMGEAVAKNTADSLNRHINILQGKKIRFEIAHKQPRKITAINNASSVYYLQQNGQDQGKNEATADSISIYFKNGAVDSIQILDGAQGVFYPSGYKGEKKIEGKRTGRSAKQRTGKNL